MYICVYHTVERMCSHTSPFGFTPQRCENFFFLIFSWYHFEEPGKVILIKNTALQGVDLIFSFGFQVLFDVSNCYSP